MAINKIKTIAIEDSAIISTKIADNQVGISELSVTDGTSGQVLSTNGSGVLAFSTVSADNDYVSSLAFSTSSGVLTAARGSLSSLTVDLDGRWADSSHTHASDNTNDYVNSMTWASSTGVITLGRSGSLTDLTLDIDGRYYESGTPLTLGTNTSGSYIASGAVSGSGLSGSASGEGSTFTVTSNATTAATPNTIVLRDSGAGFLAGIVTTTELRSSGEVTAYYSDARLKDFEGRIPSPLDKVRAISGYYFKENELARSLGYRNEARQVGVSAQEIEAVLPEAVTQAVIDPTYLAVRYEKLVPLLIEAIKELSDQVEKLKK